MTGRDLWQGHNSTPSRRTVMAWVGHWRAAVTIASSGAASGSTTRATESSSSSKTPGAANTQLPDPMHTSRSMSISIPTARW